MNAENEVEIEPNSQVYDLDDDDSLEEPIGRNKRDETENAIRNTRAAMSNVRKPLIFKRETNVRKPLLFKRYADEELNKVWYAPSRNFNFWFWQFEVITDLAILALSIACTNWFALSYFIYLFYLFIVFHLI